MRIIYPLLPHATDNLSIMHPQDILRYIFTRLCSPARSGDRVPVISRRSIWSSTTAPREGDRLRGRCSLCGGNETIGHFFRCPGIARGRREWFTERLSWRERVTKKPMEVLSYMIREEMIGERDNAFYGCTRSKPCLKFRKPQWAPTPGVQTGEA